MAAMQPELDDDSVAARIIGQAVAAGMLAGVPDEDMIHSLIAFAGCLAHRQPNAEEWKGLMVRAAKLTMEAPSDGD